MREPFGVELGEIVHALTIDLYLSAFPWELFRLSKEAVKLHMLLDLRDNIPTFIYISDGKMHEVNSSTNRCPNLEPSASWIVAFSTSSGFIVSAKQAASS